ncbi:BT_3987 domain-containing protein [Bacteroides pyogenes]|uniref:BT_3987 domain-containing protein n=1 Tax=Bacteroides pyogenes TaxID=310300 RepID=UPI003B42A12E
MKRIKFIKPQYWLMAFVLTACLAACTNDDIKIGQVDEGNYTVSSEELAFINDINGKRMFTVTEFRNEGSTELFVNVPKKASANSSVTATYDKSVLDTYNANNNSDYEVFPEQHVTFDKEGIITLNAGEMKSSGLKISFTSNGTLSTDKSYVIPLRMKVTSGNFKLAKEDETRLIFVKDLTGLPDCRKESGIKVFSCMEVNDTNPLNNLSFTLKKSGKPLIDVLIIFSANINYDEKTGRVYIYNNENVQAILDKREHYLKPLQDRGMKVILGILGNHDRSGIANLADETAKAFAQEVKAMCDAYNLDGIFVDDEYSKYEYQNITPGFVYPSRQAAARLCYEVKMAQPDRWVIAYAYSTTYSLPPVDGKQSGEFVDYALHDYGGSSDLSREFPGMPKMNMGLHSQEYSRGYWAYESQLVQMRKNGYGSHMIFAMDPNRWNFEYGQLTSMQRIARAFYDDELVFDGKKYPKDWK